MTAAKGFRPNPICLRLADKAMGLIDGQAVETIAWLERLGCVVTYRDDAEGEWHLIGLTGIAVGLTRDMDPVDATTQVAMLVGGQMWPDFYGDALEVNRRAWSARTKAAREAKAQA